MESLRLWDISPTISAAIPVWPGDTPFEAAPTWQIQDGCPVHVSRMTMTTHLGAHTDAPSHYDPAGKPIDQVDLHELVALSLKFAGMDASPVRAILRELQGGHTTKDTA